MLFFIIFVSTKLPESAFVGLQGRALDIDVSAVRGGYYYFMA